MMRKRRKVFGTFTQRRDVDLYDIEPVIKVFSKPFLDYLFFEVLVCGRDNTYIDLDIFGASDQFEDLVLHQTQEFYLYARRNLAYFVQKA
jgi:hypothetical protein